MRDTRNAPSCSGRRGHIRVEFGIPGISDYTKPDGKCPSEPVLKAPSKGQITGIFTCRNQDRHLPLKKLTLLSLSKKGDTEGFIRGTVLGISSSGSAESFQFGTKSQIASHYPVYREGRRIPNFKKSSLKFQIEKMMG